MKLGLFACCAFIVLPLLGCQTASSSEGAVNTYLGALQNQQSQKQKEATCRLNDKVKSSQPLQSVQKWEILGKETQTSSDDPDGKFDVVSVKIQEKSLGGMTVEHTWRFKVWNSDELFESNKRVLDKLNRNGSHVMEQANALLKAAGQEPVGNATPIVTNRASYSSNQFCVLAYESQ